MTEPCERCRSTTMWKPSTRMFDCRIGNTCSGGTVISAVTGTAGGAGGAGGAETAGVEGAPGVADAGGAWTCGAAGGDDGVESVMRSDMAEASVRGQAMRREPTGDGRAGA